MQAGGKKGPFGIKLPNPFGNVFDKEKPKDSAPPPRPPPPKAAKKGVSLPVSAGSPEGEDKQARGLKLLAQDLLKNLPEASGVGRQDVTTYIKPQFGDPGYKPQAYEKVYVSDLGISTFSDDANYVGKVGGLDAVKEAAKKVEEGVSAKQIKQAVVKKEVIKEQKEEEKVYPLPDYLLPLPEDTPRKGMTWKNYVGR